MSFLRIEKKQFIKDGAPAQLRGLNLGNWMLVEHYMIGLPWTEYKMRALMRSELGEDRFHAFWDTFMDASLKNEDFRFIAECGFNWVQLPINYRHFLADGTATGFDQRGYEYVDRVIEYCKKHGLLVLLSLHAAPGSQVHDWNAESAFGEAALWEHEHFIEQTERFWLEFAEKYKSEETVAGYEILNEPVAPDLETFNTFNRRMLRAIRSVDKNHIVTIAFNEWNRDFGSIAPDLFDDPQVTAIFHHYLQQYHPFGKMEKYPGEYEGQFYGPEQLLRNLRQGVESFPHERPLICGEFGVAQWEEAIPKAKLAMKEDLVDFFEEKQISWTAWAYKDLGVLGLVRPKDDTPWMQFQKRPEIQKLKTNTYRKAFKDYWTSLKEEIPDLDNEERSLFSTQTKHIYDAVMLQRFIEYLKEYSAEELKEMARSFAFENCEPVQQRLSFFRQYTEDKICPK